MLTSFETLPSIRESYPRHEIVMMLGCFDILHIGHSRALTFARGIGDLLVVGAWSDEFVRSVKGERRPVNPLENRTELLSHQDQVDYAFPMPVTYLDRLQGVTAAIEQLEPDTFVLGGEPSLVPGEHTTEKGHQFKVVQDPTYAEKTTSTTDIITASEL